VAGISISRRGVAGIAALCGGLAALPYLMASSGSPGGILLVYFSQFPLFAAGLWQGVGASALAGLAGSVILVVTSNVVTAAAFAGLNAIPVVLLVRRSLLARTCAGGAMEWYPPGLLTALLTGLGLATIVVALLLLGGRDGMQAGLREVLAPALDSNLDENTSQHEEIFGFVAFILPGIIAASWMVMTASNGSLAQGLLARFGANWRPSPDLAVLSLPVWIPVLLALAAGTTLLGGTAGFVAVNVMIVLAVPFCLAGLAVIHALARRLSRPAIPLVTFYVLVGVFGWPLLLVALLGVLESALGLRRRLAQPSASGGIR
jgi:Predicted membrane protein (DUF2232)